MAIYLGGLVAGLSCGWVVLRTTFGSDVAARDAAVRVWGFRGPLGAWVCTWGTFAMLTSAPFDDWWHNAYGLDVKVLSPPHVLLALGVIGIELGAMLLVLARQNRGDGDGRRALGWMFAYAAGIVVVMAATMVIEHAAFPNEMHGASFYVITAGIFPVVLVAAGRAGRLRWPATAAAAAYLGIVLLMIWVLQLFPATPRLAPIHNPITRMVPPPFPLLLVVPAIATDWLMRRIGRGRDSAPGATSTGATRWGPAAASTSPGSCAGSASRY